MRKRHELSDAQWKKIKPLLPPEKAKTGAVWRDLPQRYGKWKTGYSRWLRWRDTGVWQRIWDALQPAANHKGEVEWEIYCIDSTMVRIHQHAAGAKKVPLKP
jgi:transposase